MPNKYEFQGEIWLYPGQAAWHFVSVPTKLSEQIKDMFSEISRGWGSLPVQVKIGQTIWRTSIFPDSKTNEYSLPIKAEVRREEQLEVGDSVKVQITIID